MNIDSQHNLLDQLAYYRQCVRKAKRLRHLCLKQTRLMYRYQTRLGLRQPNPVFMLEWWALVGDLHECAVKLEDNDPPFLSAVRHYRERAQLQFKL